MKGRAYLLGFHGKICVGVSILKIKSVNLAGSRNMLERCLFKLKISVAANAVDQTVVVGNSVRIAHPLSTVSELAQAKFVGTGKFWFEIGRPEPIGISRKALEFFLIAIVVIGLGELKSFLVPFPSRIGNISKESKRFLAGQCRGFCSGCSRRDVERYQRWHGYR